MHIWSILVPSGHLLFQMVVSRERHSERHTGAALPESMYKFTPSMLIFVTHASFQLLAMFPKVFFGALFASVAFAATNTTVVQIHPNANNAKCLDVAGDVLANGTAVQM